MESKIIAQADLTITKEDIVNYEVEKIIAPMRVKKDEAKMELDKLNSVVTELNEKAEHAARDAFKRLTSADEKINAINKAYSAFETNGVAISVRYDHFCQATHQVHGYIYRYCTCSTIRIAYPAPADIKKLVEDANVARHEAGQADIKYRELCNAVNSNAVLKMKSDFMTQLMGSAMEAINGELKAMLPKLPAAVEPVEEEA